MEFDRRKEDEKLDRIESEVKSVKLLLIGNGKIGVAEMARRSFEWMLVQKATRNGIWDWTFRIAISILLGFVAIKVGLK